MTNEALQAAVDDALIRAKLEKKFLFPRLRIALY
jgi:hypothetical protein